MRALLYSSLIIALLGCQKSDRSYISAESGLRFSTSIPQQGRSFQVGAGIADITGPATGLGMHGYVKREQTTAGIHLRLWSRSFVVEDASTGKRIVLTNMDILMAVPGIKREVLRRLQNKYGDLYREENVLISATHTHSAPGGYSHFNLYNFFLKYSESAFQTIVAGVTRSIMRAHENMQPATVSYAKGHLPGAGVNRSIEAYMNNPDWERAEFDTNVDTVVHQLGFTSLEGKPLGIFNWFAVHATSIEADNQLISSDNKGLAGYLFEKSRGTNYLDESPFIAAFSNANAGDVSPNTHGDLDDDGDWDCEANENFACVRESADHHVRAAENLHEIAKPILGGIDYRHTRVDLSKMIVRNEFTQAGEQRTCSAAIGISMLAGAPEDNAGIGEEGWNCDTVPIWGKLLCLRDRCHGVKPVVVQMGKRKPWPGVPQKLPLQILRLGQVAIVALPGEFTTMSGRRIRRTLKPILAKTGIQELILSGYSNSHAGYVTTPQEYQLQHYEGASTYFGEWTLSAYRQVLARIAHSMVDGTSLPKGPLEEIPYQRDHDVTTKGFDTTPWGTNFGDVCEEARANYGAGDVVEVEFWGASMSRNPMLERSFALIQKQDADGWKTISYDWDPETKVAWSKAGLNKSRIKVSWEIPVGTEAATYRILHQGVAKTRRGSLVRYEGASRAFTVR